MEPTKEKVKEEKPKGIPVPIGTEQETGLTRGETEKEHGPVKIIEKKESKSDKLKRRK